VAWFRHAVDRESVTNADPARRAGRAGELRCGGQQAPVVVIEAGGAVFHAWVGRWVRCCTPGTRVLRRLRPSPTSCSAS
jgi:hypothetical protein